MTLEEIEDVLSHWERLDGGWNSDGVTRSECADLLVSSDDTVAMWKERLVKVPPGIDERYRNVVNRMLGAGLIEKSDHEYELSVQHRFSPAEKLRRGKRFAAFIKNNLTASIHP
jgi:hypothetical protein